MALLIGGLAAWRYYLTRTWRYHLAATSNMAATSVAATSVAATSVAATSVAATSVAATRVAVSDPQRLLSIQSHVASGYVGKSDMASNAHCQATAQQPFLSKPLDMT
jgi:hypothetical protein